MATRTSPICREESCPIDCQQSRFITKISETEKVINWLKREAKALGLQPVDVLLVSAHKGKGMAEAMEAIDAYRKGQNVYVVGCTNVGKSTFINRIIKQATGEVKLSQPHISVHYFRHD